MRQIYEVTLNSQYHSEMTFLCESQEAARGFLESEENGVHETDAGHFYEAIGKAWLAGVATVRSGNNKYTAMVSPRALWV